MTSSLEGCRSNGRRPEAWGHGEATFWRTAGSPLDGCNGSVNSRPESPRLVQGDIVSSSGACGRSLSCDAGLLRSSVSRCDFSCLPSLQPIKNCLWANASRYVLGKHVGLSESPSNENTSVSGLDSLGMWPQAPYNRGGQGRDSGPSPSPPEPWLTSTSVPQQGRRRVVASCSSPSKQ